MALGAFAAHALKQSLPANLLATFKTAVEYQMTHSLMLILVVFAAKLWGESKLLATSAWAFAAGVILFSGSLYALVLTGKTMLGAITPLGGVCFLIGWFALAAFAVKRVT